jgi:hypothetical protein
VCIRGNKHVFKVGKRYVFYVTARCDVLYHHFCTAWLPITGAVMNINRFMHCKIRLLSSGNQTGNGESWKQAKTSRCHEAVNEREQKKRFRTWHNKYGIGLSHTRLPVNEMIKLTSYAMVLPKYWWQLSNAVRITDLRNTNTQCCYKSVWRGKPNPTWAWMKGR